MCLNTQRTVFMEMYVSDVNENDFEQQVLKSDKPVIVDFWAPWCMPCKRLSPILHDVARERQDIKVVRVNVDENNNLSNNYGVRSIPYLIFFKNGIIVDTVVGVLDKGALMKKIDECYG